MHGSTILHDISSSGNEGIMRLLVDRVVELNADVDTLDDEKRTAVYRAATNGHSAIVAILLDARASSAGISKPLSTSLERRDHLVLPAAARRGHETVVDLLLSAGYEPTSWALREAVKQGHIGVVKKLLVVRINVYAAADDYRGRTVLQLAIGEGHDRIVEKLLAAGAGVNAAASSI